MAKKMTEDQVRDKARDILGLTDKDGVRAGVGQITTFNQLGFSGVADKPDGWYLPKNKAEVAVVLETKATHIELKKTQVNEVLKNVRILMNFRVLDTILAFTRWTVSTRSASIS